MCRKHVDFSCPLSHRWWLDTQSMNKTANTDLMMYAQIVLLNAPSWMPLVHSKSWITLPSSGSFGAWQWHSGVSSDYEPYGSLWVMLHPQSPKHWPRVPRVTKTSLELVLQQQRFKDQLYCSTPTSKDVERLVSAINWVPKTGTLFYMLRQCKTIWLEVLSTEILTNVCECVLCLQQSIYCRFLFQHQEYPIKGQLHM